MTTNCSICQKRFLLKFIMSTYDLSSGDIAKAINVSDSLVRKHINGIRNCPLVDIYLAKHCFGLTQKDLAC